jgi:RNA polymerase-associated protein LEO1
MEASESVEDLFGEVEEQAAEVEKVEATVDDLFGDEEAEEGLGASAAAAGYAHSGSADGAGRGSLSQAAAAAASAFPGVPQSAQGRQVLRLPHLPRPPAGDDVMVLRLPKFVRPSQRSYDPKTFNEREEEEEATFIRHRVEEGQDGTASRASNSRIVEWSDGSLTLHVGEKEVFQLRGGHALGASAAASTSSSSSSAVAASGGADGGGKALAENTLFVFARGSALGDGGSRGETVLSGRSSVRVRLAAGVLQSETNERRLVSLRAQTTKQLKRSRLGKDVDSKDAEAEKLKLLKQEEANERAAALTRRKTEEAERKNYLKEGKRGGGGGQLALDDDGEEDVGFSKKALLAQQRRKLPRSGGEGREEEEDEEGGASSSDSDSSGSSGSESSSGSSSGSSESE